MAAKIVKFFVARKMQNGVYGNLALKPAPKTYTSYETPTVKKLVKVKPAGRIFMGCYQVSNKDNDGDGC